MCERMQLNPFVKVIFELEIIHRHTTQNCIYVDNIKWVSITSLNTIWLFYLLALTQSIVPPRCLCGQ